MKNYTMPIPPNGFPLWPAWMTDLIDQVNQSTETGPGMDRLLKSDHVMQAEFIASLEWLDRGCTTIFPEPEVFEACRRSDALSSVCGKYIRWPYDLFAFYFPKHEWGTSWPLCSIMHVLNESYVFVRAGRSVRIEVSVPKVHIVSWWGGELDGLRCGTILLTDQLLDASIADSRARALANDKPYRLSEDQAEPMYDMANACMNMVLLMQSYPEYVSGFTTKQRIAGRARTTTHRRIALPSALRQQIRVGMDYDHAGVPVDSRAAHWRRGHWRRQPHGNRWAVEHPDVQPIIDHRGRSCHMDWILPVFVAPIGAEVMA